MLTNLMASIVVTLVTNVTNWDNHRGYEGYPNSYFTLSTFPVPSDYGPFVAATEKYSKTEVSEQTTWTFHCPDKDRVVVESKPVSSVTTTLRLKSEWVEEPARTNEFGLGYATNSSARFIWAYTNNVLVISNIPPPVIVPTPNPFNTNWWSNLDLRVSHP